MKVKESKGEEADNMLPFGPYLASGIFVSMLFGDAIIKWYLEFLGL
jgi:leader peptidase (prepilin peptidase)/N-methyltransferase